MVVGQDETFTADEFARTAVSEDAYDIAERRAGFAIEFVSRNLQSSLSE